MNTTLTDHLTRLAQSMESLQPAGAQPAWAEIVGPLDNPEAVRWHPDVATMIGFVAPPACEALVAVGYGWVRSLDEGPEATNEILKPGERRRARVVCLMTRGGDMAGYLRHNSAVLISEPPTVGRVPDCMRRAFRLPTPPPDKPTDDLLARIWLSNILERGRDAARPLSWRDVAHLHPVLEVAAGGGIVVPASQYTRMMHIGAEVWDWSHILAHAASPGWLADVLPPGAAEWMDEGILSRWLLDAIAGPDRLVDQVLPLLEPAAAKRLRSALTRLGSAE